MKVKKDKSTSSRAYTVEEAREIFLDHARGMVDYWDAVPNLSTKERISGAVFSILTALDGGTGDLPGYLVVPYGTKEDKKYQQENGGNYYPVNERASEKLCDIAGCLHEMLQK